MDNAIYKSRYQNNYLDRKKKTGNKIKMTFKEKLGIQIVISLLILMFAGIIKNSDTKITKDISKYIENAVFTEMDIKELIQPFQTIVDDYLKDNETKNNEESNIINPSPNNSEKIQGESSVQDKDLRKSDTVNASSESQRDISTAKDTKNTVSPSPIPSISIIYKGILITPAQGVLGTTFGDTVDQLTQKTKSHKGVDIEAAIGSDIKAAANGIVLESAYDKTLGNYIKIEHSDSFSTIYGQCSSLIAKKGQRVNQGEIIAKVGNTGAITGTHLHFEVWKDNKAVNPLEYIKVPTK